MNSTGDEFSKASRRREEFLSSVGALAFAFTLGLLGIAIPLIAIGVGFSAPEVGVLVALSGVGQILSRLGMGALMLKVPDKTLVMISGLLMLISCMLLVLSTHIAVFAVSLLLQGAARAYFWTGLQTHVVRIGARSVAAIARINFAGGIGSLIGPFIGGFLLEADGGWAMVSGAVGGAATLLAGAVLVRLRPFAPPPQRGVARMWRRAEIRPGVLMGTIAGSWRGILSAYVPVALAFAGLSPASVGLLAAIANIAALVGGAGIGLLQWQNDQLTLVVGGVVTGLSTAALGVLSGDAVAAGVCLALSGLSAGILQTVGTASVADAVHPEERGHAIAVSGAYRAGALVLTPLVAAGIVTFAPLSIALVVVGLLFIVPSFGSFGTRREGSV